MKKIFLLLILLLPLNVLADTQIIAVPMGPTFKIYYKDQTSFINSYSRPGIFKNKFQYLYRLTFKEDFYTNNYTLADNETKILDRINNDQLSLIKEYILFGYEQLPIKSDACYLALQKLIYESYDNVDKMLYDNNILSNYSDCEHEIIKLANINKNGPELNILKGDINTFFVSDDLNSIIDNYKITSGNDNNDFMISNNQLIGNINQDKYTLTLTRQFYPVGTTLYYYRSNTDLIADFKFNEPQQIIIDISANHYPIKIINSDNDNNVLDIDSSVVLLNKDYEIIKKINMHGIYEENLTIPKGKYFIKQVNINEDFLDNDVLYPIELNDISNTIKIFNQRKKIDEVKDVKTDAKIDNKLSTEIKFENSNHLLIKNIIPNKYNDRDEKLLITTKRLHHNNDKGDISKSIYKGTKPNIKINKNNMLPFLIFLLILYIKKSLN